MKRTKILFLFIIISVLPSFCINHSSVKDSITVTHESAFFHADKGDYAQAIKIEQEIVNSFQGKPICPDYIYSLNNLAAFYSDFGEYEKAMQIGYRIIELMDSVEIGINGKYEIFQHIAIYYERVGNHEKSQEYGHLALNIAKDCGCVL